MRRGATKPNVLFIAVDDLRPQLGCYGHTQMHSPNIDSLAEGGVVFKRAYCQVPVCGSSRASLLTGLRPTWTRFYDWDCRVDNDEPDTVTLPQYFKNNGYYTVSRGKIFHFTNDSAKSWSEPAWREANVWLKYHLEENKTIAAGNDDGFGPAFEGADVSDDSYGDGCLCTRAISDLNSLAAQDQPFFLAVGFMKPHLPFNCPKRYWDLYDRNSIDLADNPFSPKDCPPAALHQWGELRSYHGIPAEGPLDDETARTLIHAYYACVSYVDAQIGRLMTELDQLGIADNTIVVLWGDHGWNLGEHGLWCKHANFETALHSPMIINAPAITGGKTVQALTEFIDIYPTLAELCGLPVPGHCDGTSVVPLMNDPTLPGKTAVFSRYYEGDSVKTDKYRYTSMIDGKDTGKMYAHMLYDHETDPGENTNIVHLPENRATIIHMQDLLRGLEGWWLPLYPEEIGYHPGSSIASGDETLRGGPVWYTLRGRMLDRCTARGMYVARAAGTSPLKQSWLGRSGFTPK
ncbi:MAG: sulfatase-like hydrolase/transferase [Chitinivibrionales bacterium]|nr:sulfatase-like hydrolase/transferase [Chitinivibrionales bacterium]